MREIKFRGFEPCENGTEIIFVDGKPVKGYWRYGGIVHQTDHYGEPVDRYYIVDGTETNDYDIGTPYRVIPETVGEFTGFTDKNDKEIYEGDVVQIDEYLHDIGGKSLIVIYRNCEFLIVQYDNTGKFKTIASLNPHSQKL